jgi:hypothetical protein
MTSRHLLLLALLALTLAGITLWKTKTPDERLTMPELQRLFPADLFQTAQRIHFEAGEHRLTLTRTEQGWQIGPPNTPNRNASNATVEAFLRMASTLHGEIRQGPPEAFGFQSTGPLTLTISTQDGKNHTLEVGALDWRIGFVRQPGHREIYAVGGELAGALGLSRGLDPAFWAPAAP